MAVPKVLQTGSINATFDQVEIDEALYFLNKFPVGSYPKQIIEWRTFVRDHGMAPIIRRGTQSPIWAGDGFYDMFMKGALISEKMFHTEEDVNACLDTDPEKQKAAEFVIIDKNETLADRANRRRDWLAAQIFFNKGVVNYTDEFGTVWGLDYQVPKSHLIDVKASDPNKVWGTGSNRDPVADIRNMKKRIKLDGGGMVSVMFMNSTTLQRRLESDTVIQSFLRKDAFGSGSLLAQPVQTLSQYLDNTPIVEYDEYIPHTVLLVSRIDASNYVVDDTSLLQVGTECRFMRTDNTGTKPHLDEVGEIDSINPLTRTITLTDPLTGVFNQRDDRVQCIVPFLPDDHVVLMSEKALGKPVCRWIDAPLGIPTKYGLRSDINPQWDPDGVWVRAQRLGLWALYNNQCFADLYVG